MKNKNNKVWVVKTSSDDYVFSNKEPQFIVGDGAAACDCADEECYAREEAREGFWESSPDSVSEMFCDLAEYFFPFLTKLKVNECVEINAREGITWVKR